VCHGDGGAAFTRRHRSRPDAGDACVSASLRTQRIAYLQHTQLPSRPESASHDDRWILFVNARWLVTPSAQNKRGVSFKNDDGF